MKEQFEEAKKIIDDIITMHIQDMYDIDGECEDEAEIEAAFKLLIDLAEESVNFFYVKKEKTKISID